MKIVYHSKALVRFPIHLR